MLNKAKEKQLEIIEKAVSHIYKKMPKEEANLIELFVKSYYVTASPEDLIQMNVIDLYGSMLSHWKFIANRRAGESKIRVYNPQFEQHGWQSTHSVIEIVLEDMPFLVDSIRMELNRRGLSVHMILHVGGLCVTRDDSGTITDLFTCKTFDNPSQGQKLEAPIFIEFDRQSDPKVLQEIEDSIRSILEKVNLCVEDWPQMIGKMESVIDEFEQASLSIDENIKEQSVEFLRWLKAGHFTFLGYFKVDFPDEQGRNWKADESSGMGIIRQGIDGFLDKVEDWPEHVVDTIYSSEPLIVGKTNVASIIHRPAHIDIVAVKVFDERQQMVSQHCFIGLYTSAAYNRSPQNIPLLQLKVDRILDKANFPASSHDGKSLINILETMPRDDMLQGSVSELYEMSMGILYLQERRKIRLFIRKDVFCHYYSCQVFVPRDCFDSNLRVHFAQILEQELNGSLRDFSTRFSESILCRIHFIIEVDPKDEHQFDIATIQERLIEAARTWEDNLRDSLIEHFGEEEGNRLIQKYIRAFPAGYKAMFGTRTAVYDISHIETISEDNKLAMSFYRPIEEPDGNIRFKIFHKDHAIALSDVIPMLESMGLRIVNQRPHELVDCHGDTISINDFGMIHESGTALNVEAVKDIFQEAFYNIWCGKAESDGFNRLVLGAGINWQEVAMIRAYSKYLWQIGFTFSQSYLEETLAKHPMIARQLVELFVLRFDPTLPQETKNDHINTIRMKVKSELEEVENLDEDRILRRYMHVMLATLRTNFFQLDEQGQHKDYLSFKFDPSAVPDMPLPRPMYEIFVYSPRVEGVHLRGAKVARGGLRWSDRREDFRTEVLGLMKAQQVKNAVIVPLGAKGGFVPKMLPQGGSRDEILTEGIACYQTFIRGLLDITDNIVDHNVVPPNHVVRYDSDDPYLVVAADKGTATFSDIANAMAQHYEFWLDDAFASGGSDGYDHKKMGITARGAWESVKRHFLEMGHDCQMTDFTCVGIGDMGGDVFGNGMLLSEHIQLVGAFNHMHIFVDPNPDSRTSYEERKRLFNLERSTWMDYEQSLISTGGGIFLRKAKSIPVSPEMKSRFGITQDKIIPNDLIKAMLKSEVDLLWNGGIGTYVKASTEHHSEVGDRATDALRVNGNEIKCKIIGEGGNLGLTQLGRVEYALHGGRCNTDAIDNSAGVDCSDHEVNIKILLNAAVHKGDLTVKQRNELLESMTEEVAELVLDNNRSQVRALSLAQLNPSHTINMFGRLIDYLENNANLDRDLEFLPDFEGLQNRKQNSQGLTRPELAVLFAYTKTWLKEELLSSDLPEDENLSQIMDTAFPAILKEKFADEMLHHRLRREIIVMQLANLTINQMGPTFVRRLQDETGAMPPDIIRCYMVAREVFQAEQFYDQIESLGFSVDSKVQVALMHEFNRLIRRSTRWFLRHSRSGIDMQVAIGEYKSGIEYINKEIRPNLKAQAKDYFEQTTKEYIDEGLPGELAAKAAALGIMSSSLDIVEASMTHRLPIDQVMATYFTLGARLDLVWFRQHIKQHAVSSHWDALARAAFRDDLDKQQRSLTVSVLMMDGQSTDVDAKIEAWVSKHQVLVERFKHMVAELKAQPSRNFTMYSVALRDLLDLSQASMVNPKTGTH